MCSVCALTIHKNGVAFLACFVTMTSWQPNGAAGWILVIVSNLPNWLKTAAFPLRRRSGAAGVTIITLR